MRDVSVVSFVHDAVNPDTTQVRRLQGRELLSQLFEFEVHIATKAASAVDTTKLLEQGGALLWQRQASGDKGPAAVERCIYGMVSRVRDRSFTEAKHREYVVTFVPRVWQCTLSTTNEVYLDMTVPEMIQSKLQLAGLTAGEDFQLRLLRDYPKREFTVQYQESDWNFICRLAEDLGIFFFFDHDDANNRDVIVFADDNSHFTVLEPGSVPFMARGDRASVYELEQTRQYITKSFTTRDYNYRQPAVDVLGEADVDCISAGIHNEYGTHVKTASEAKAIATIRAEEASVRHAAFEGLGEVPAFRAGGIVTISGHAHGDLSELLLTEVKHEVVQAVFGHAASGAEHAYRNEFRAIPRATAYRPPRLARKPVVAGTVTGIVQSPSEDEEFAPIDDQGRYRVMFMYDAVTDREPARASRPLRMAQPSAGGDRNFHMPLKAGTEVLITCVNGDPDRPIIAGAVPNSQTPTFVNEACKNQSVMKTTKNEVRFDDMDPRIKMQSGDLAVLQLGSPNAAEIGAYIGSAASFSKVVNAANTDINTLTNNFNAFRLGYTKNDIMNRAGESDVLFPTFVINDLLGKSVSAVKNASKGLQEVPKKFFASLQKVVDEAKKSKAKADDDLRKTQFRSQDKKQAKLAHDSAHKAAADVAAKQASCKTAGHSDHARWQQKVEGEIAALKKTEQAEKENAARLAKAVTAAEIKLDEALKGWNDGAWGAWGGVDAACKKVDDALKSFDEILGPSQQIAAMFSWLASFASVSNALKENTKVHFSQKSVNHLATDQSSATAQSRLPSEAKDFLFVKPGLNLLKRVLWPVPSAVKLLAKVPVLGAMYDGVDQKPGETEGTDKDAFNIQSANHSAGLIGDVNAFVHGKDYATLGSEDGDAVVVAKKAAHLKGGEWVEVASGRGIAVTTTRLFDLHCDDSVIMRAHGNFTRGSQLISRKDPKQDPLAVPKGKNTDRFARADAELEPDKTHMWLHCDHDIKLESTDKDVRFGAKKNIALTAETGKLFGWAKQSVKFSADSSVAKDATGKEEAQLILDAPKQSLFGLGREAASIVAGDGAGHGLLAEPDGVALGQVTNCTTLDKVQLDPKYAVKVVGGKFVEARAGNDVSIKLDSGGILLQSGSTLLHLKKNGDAIVTGGSIKQN